jgi:hypothetical protein
MFIELGLKVFWTAWIVVKGKVRQCDLGVITDCKKDILCIPARKKG